jgi:DNA-binding LytR/AlgR family response regulator
VADTAANTATARVLIAEDEMILRQHFRKKLETVWPEAVVVAECADGLEAIEKIEETAPQVCFLDIHMPEMTGLEVAREAGDRCHIVFVTAYDQYAIEAFDKGAVDYLVKPINDERLQKTVERLKERLNTAPADLSQLIATLRAGGGAGGGPREYLRWIKASQGSALKMVAVSDVLFFNSDEKYTRVVLPEGELLIRKPMKELTEEIDPQQFWQIHRSTMVRVTAIEKVTRDFRGDATVHIKGSREALKVSRPFSHLFKQM